MMDGSSAIQFPKSIIEKKKKKFFLVLLASLATVYISFMLQSAYDTAWVWG